MKRWAAVGSNRFVSSVPETIFVLLHRRSVHAETCVALLEPQRNRDRLISFLCANFTELT